MMHVHTPILNRCLLRGALSISCLLATFGQGVDAYLQTANINNNGLNGNASVNALPPLFRHLAIVYGAVTQDRTYDASSRFFRPSGSEKKKNADPKKLPCV